MNKKRINRFSILQTGKLLAVLYGFMSIVLIPFFLLASLIPSEQGKGFGAGIIVFMMILYPIMGFIGGIIGAAIYNLAAKFTGGLEITLDDITE